MSPSVPPAEPQAAVAGTCEHRTSATGPPGDDTGPPAFASVLDSQVARTALAEGQKNTGQSSGGRRDGRGQDATDVAAGYGTDAAVAAILAALQTAAGTLTGASQLTARATAAATASAANAGASATAQGATPDGTPTASSLPETTGATPLATDTNSAATSGEPAPGTQPGAIPAPNAAAEPGITLPAAGQPIGAAGPQPPVGAAGPQPAPNQPATPTPPVGATPPTGTQSPPATGAQRPSTLAEAPSSPPATPAPAPATAAAVPASASPQTAAQPAPATSDSLRAATSVASTDAGQQQATASSDPSTPITAQPLAPPSTPIAPATTAAASAGTGVSLAHAIETVRMTIEMAAGRGYSQARIELSPPELGAIRIHLHQTADGLIARVVAEHAGAAQTLQQGGSDLRRSLEQAGLPLLRLDIEASGQQGAQARDPQAPAATSANAGEAEDQDGATPDDSGARTQVQLPGGAIVDVLA